MALEKVTAFLSKLEAQGTIVKVAVDPDLTDVVPSLTIDPKWAIKYTAGDSSYVYVDVIEVEDGVVALRGAVGCAFIPDDSDFFEERFVVYTVA